MALDHCPDCGATLSEVPDSDKGGWAVCPTHGDVFVSFYTKDN